MGRVCASNRTKGLWQCIVNYRNPTVPRDHATNILSGHIIEPNILLKGQLKEMLA